MLLVIEFLAVISLGQVATLHSSGLGRAWLESRQRPGTDALEAFGRQRRITEMQRLGFSPVLFVVLAGTTILVFQATKGEQVASGNAG